MSLMKKVGIGIGGTLLVVGVLALYGIWSSGAWHLVFPSTHFDTEAPEIPASFGTGDKGQRQIRVLVFSKTNSFRHKEGIPAARELLDRLAPSKNWALYHSENSALFDPVHLARFDVVVFSNATGNMLGEEQDIAFQEWIEGGGGWLGIHSAGDDSHEDWDWYHSNLIGGEFAGHIMGPQTQEARVIVENPNHPVTRNLPSEFQHSEEWYSWKTSARTHGMNILLTVDESSYSPWIKIMGSETDIRMEDHPIAWWRCVGEGRTVYSTMGHWAAAYETEHFPVFIANAIDWAAGLTGNECRSGS